MVVATPAPDYGLLFLVGMLGWSLATAVFLPLFLWARRKAKKTKPSTGTILVGLRSSSRGARLRTIEAKRGMYTWKEKDDFEADVYLDGAFHYDARGDDFQGTLVMVDLDSFHPIRLERTQAKVTVTAPALNGHAQVLEQEISGAALPNLVGGPSMGGAQIAAPSLSYMGNCINDDEETVIWSRDGRQLGKVKGIWRRLPGDRLAKIRKDMRILQIHAIMSAWWAALTKFVPIAIVFIGIAVLALLGMVGWGMFHGK